MAMDNKKNTRRVAVLDRHLRVDSNSSEPYSDSEHLHLNDTSSAQIFRTLEFSFADSMKKFPESASNVLDYESLLGREEKEMIARVRRFSEQHVAPVISDYWEKAEFPFPLLGKFAELGIGGGCLPREYGCQGLSLLSCAMAVVELARVDGSMSTFFLVHSFLAALTIGMLGSEEQKKELLPDMATFAKVGCWALTEPSHGSDASHLLSTARKVSGGWVLNGRKRWIGNGTFADIVVVFARNEETGEINAFLVRRGNPGLKTTKIENKIALRCVQNADIELTDAFVPDSDRLSGLNSFKDVNKVGMMDGLMR